MCSPNAFRLTFFVTVLLTSFFRHFTLNEKEANLFRFTFFAFLPKIELFSWHDICDIVFCRQ